MIIDLEPKYQNAYLHCLEEWSDEMKEAGDHKACWYDKVSKRGLRVKLAIDEADEAVGMIQYLPIEESVADGSDLFFIPCIWVHGHKKGVGDRRGKGIGTQLLLAAEQDAKDAGAKGMVAWGLAIPIWMKASWYKKHGYRKADRNSISLLVWKRFDDSAKAPRWIRQKKPVPVTPGKVSVVAFVNGWCQVQNIVFERTKRACTELGDAIDFQRIDTSDREVFLEWGISDGIFIDGKKLSFGPPLAYEKIEKKLFKKVKAIRN